jgi:hypothetical protein
VPGSHGMGVGVSFVSLFAESLTDGSSWGTFSAGSSGVSAAGTPGGIGEAGCAAGCDVRRPLFLLLRMAASISHPSSSDVTLPEGEVRVFLDEGVSAVVSVNGKHGAHPNL